MGGSRIVTLTPTLGVLISYYDEGPLLRECLESLLMQEDIPDEILVFDNRAGSYPAESFMRPEWPVKVIHGDGNHGPSHARNVLWRACQCEYVHFQDADDLFSPDFSTKLREAIQNSGAGIIVNQVAVFRDPEESVSSVGRFDFSALKLHGDLARFCFAEGACTPMGTVDKKVLQQVGGWDERLWHKEDVDLWFRVALTQATWEIIPSALVKVRVRAGSHSGNQKQAAIHSYQYLEKLSDSCPRQYWDLLSEYAALCAFWLSKEGMMDMARRAEAISNRTGRPTFSSLPPRFRLLCRILGVVNAEKACSPYRSLKTTLRQFV